MKIVHQVEERHGFLLLHWHQHDVVDSEEIALEDTVVGIHRTGRHIFHPQDIDKAFHGHEQSPVSLHDGITYESGGHEGLAGPGWAHEYDVVHLVKPYQFPHLLKLRLGDAGTVVEVEVVQVAVLRELGLTHPAQQIILLAGVQLVLQDCGDKFQIRGLVDLCPVYDVGAVGPQIAQPQHLRIHAEFLRI